MPIRQTFDTPGHNRQAGQLRDQLKGLLPDSVQPAAAAAANQAGDGTQKLLDYARLAVEYWEPIMALVQRFVRRAPEVAAENAAVAERAVKRRLGVRPLVAVGIAVGLGLAAYGVARAVQDFNRDA